MYCVYVISFIIELGTFANFSTTLKYFFKAVLTKKLTKMILLWVYKGRSIRFFKCKLMETILMFAG